MIDLLSQAYLYWNEENATEASVLSSCVDLFA